MARADGSQAYDCPLDAVRKFVDIGSGVVIADYAEHEVGASGQSQSGSGPNRKRRPVITDGITRT